MQTADFRAFSWVLAADRGRPCRESGGFPRFR